MARSLYEWPDRTGKNFSAAGAMTGTNAIVSQIIDTRNLDRLSLELSWTGTPTGTLSWEGSNQYDSVLNPNAVFLPIPQATGYAPAFVNPAGAAGTYLGGLGCLLGALGAAPGRYVRVRYVNASGAGTLLGWVSAVEVG